MVFVISGCRSDLLSQSQKQQNDMQKERAPWLKTQKAQQSQVPLFDQLSKAANLNPCLAKTVQLLACPAEIQSVSRLTIVDTLFVSNLTVLDAICYIITIAI